MAHSFGFPYFEILPVYFKPGSLEALSGYLSRLAVVNGIYNIQELKETADLAFFTPTFKRHPDFPVEDWGKLPRVLRCSHQLLNSTTLTHLLTKFAHRGRGQRTNQFLKESLAEYLRFCPSCLGEEDGYYRLSWRFKVLRHFTDSLPM